MHTHAFVCRSYLWRVHERGVCKGGLSCILYLVSRHTRSSRKVAAPIASMNTMGKGNQVVSSAGGEMLCVLDGAEEVEALFSNALPHLAFYFIFLGGLYLSRLLRCTKSTIDC